MSIEITDDLIFAAQTGAENLGEGDRFNYVLWCEDIVKHPGKFEGEPRYSPHFYGASMLDGGAESVEVSAADRILFPELKRRKRVRVYEDSQGFVTVR